MSRTENTHAHSLYWCGSKKGTLKTLFFLTHSHIMGVSWSLSSPVTSLVFQHHNFCPSYHEHSAIDGFYRASTVQGLRFVLCNRWIELRAFVVWMPKWPLHLERNLSPNDVTRQNSLPPVTRIQALGVLG